MFLHASHGHLHAIELLLAESIHTKSRCHIYAFLPFYDLKKDLNRNQTKGQFIKLNRLGLNLSYTYRILYAFNSD